MLGKWLSKKWTEQTIIKKIHPQAQRTNRWQQRFLKKELSHRNYQVTPMNHPLNRNLEKKIQIL